NALPRALKGGFALAIHLDVREQGEIIVSPEPRQMSLEVGGESRLIAHVTLQRVGVLLIGEELHALAFEERRLGWKPAGLLVLARERLRRDLAGLNVRLIERVDAEHRAGDSRRDLPSHELFAEVVLRRHPNSDDWSAGLLQCGYAGILCGIGLVL